MKTEKVYSPGSHGAPLKLLVTGDPDALIFKDQQHSDLKAYVCSACGFTELYATNAADLAFGQRTAERNKS